MRMEATPRSQRGVFTGPYRLGYGAMDCSFVFYFNYVGLLHNMINMRDPFSKTGCLALS